MSFVDYTDPATIQKEWIENLIDRQAESLSKTTISACRPSLSSKRQIQRVTNQGSEGKQKLVVAKGEEEGVGWTGNLGLIDANYNIWSG